MNQSNIPKVTLDFTPREVSTTLWSRIHLWHGIHKIGKSVNANNVPGGAFFLRFEPGHEHIRHSGEDIADWPKFIGVCREIYAMKQRGEFPFQVVVIDTVGEAFRRCQEYVLGQLGLMHESDADYGKGWSMVGGEFRRMINAICTMGLGVIKISHSAEKTFSNQKRGNARVEWNKIVIDLPNQGLKVVPPMADCILYFMKEYDEKADKWRRVIKTQGNDQYEAGCRYPPSWTHGMKETLPMSVEELEKAWDFGAPKLAVAPEPEPEKPPEKPKEVTTGTVDAGPAPAEPEGPPEVSPIDTEPAPKRAHKTKRRTKLG